MVKRPIIKFLYRSERRISNIILKHIQSLLIITLVFHRRTILLFTFLILIVRLSMSQEILLLLWLLRDSLGLHLS